MYGPSLCGVRRLTFNPSKEKGYHRLWEGRIHKAPNPGPMWDPSSVWDRVKVFSPTLPGEQLF